MLKLVFSFYESTKSEQVNILAAAFGRALMALDKVDKAALSALILAGKSFRNCSTCLVCIKIQIINLNFNHADDLEM